MNVTWLGQAGLYIEAGDRRLMIDPYLSDSVGQRRPEKRRKRPVEDWMLQLRPEVLIFTHDHLDHYDPDTARHFLLRGEELTVLAPSGSYEAARGLGGGHNFVLFNAGTEWTQGDVRLTAVPAVHSDPHAIGCLIQWAGQCVYVTGDTLYDRRIFSCLPDRIDAVFLPINGAGNNMNAADAARFARDCGAALAVPIHWGMLDELDPGGFSFEPKRILRYGETMRTEAAE